jgi:hypothetical protein
LRARPRGLASSCLSACGSSCCERIEYSCATFNFYLRGEMLDDPDGMPYRAASSRAAAGGYSRPIPDADTPSPKPQMPARRKPLSHRVLLLVLALPLAMAVMGAALFALNAFLDGRRGRGFDEIEMGATRQSVVLALGMPTQVRPCGAHLWWGGDADYKGRNDGRCVSEARYEFFLSSWGVGYSQDGRVVSKYHYVSE